jgi:DNA helicase-2/ATP-dependent DNA helicase PcrA
MGGVKVASDEITLESFLKDNKFGAFELRGPAGSGKTYTLVDSMLTLAKQQRFGIAISLTNVAVDEITRRAGDVFKGRVLTAHSFAGVWLKRLYTSLRNADINWPEGSLWLDLKKDNISKLLFWSADENSKFEGAKSDEKVVNPNQVLNLFMDALEYSSRFSEIVFSEADYVFVDEYQDTDSRLLKYLRSKIGSRKLVGFFGDPMQKIYPGGARVDELEELTSSMKQFRLPNNYRSAKNLVPFFNALRLEKDGFNQVAKNPVMGTIILVKRDGDLTPTVVSKIADKLSVESLSVLHPTNIQMITEQMETSTSVLENIMDSYNSKFLSGAKTSEKIKLRDLLQNYMGIREFVYFFGIVALMKPRFNFFDVRLISAVFLDGKEDPNDVWPVERLQEVSTQLKRRSLTFIDDVDEDERIREWLKDQLCTYSDSDLLKMYSQVSGKIGNNTYTIQGVKGLEFRNVLVDLDQGTYNALNFNRMDLEKSGYDGNNLNRYLLYVAVTRAKDNLAVFVNTAKHPNLFEIMDEFLTSKGIRFEKLDLNGI